MGLGRTAPHRVRAAYARALESIPLPVRAISAPAPEVLTVLGRAEVGERPIHFGTMASAPKLWVAFADDDQRVFGYLSGLLCEEPELHVIGSDALEWTMQGGRAEALKRHGMSVWHEARRWCEG